MPIWGKPDNYIFPVNFIDNNISPDLCILSLCD